MAAGMRLTRARVTLGAVLAVALLSTGCAEAPQASRRGEGDAENGRLLLRQYGCGSCHTIPGVANARGNVGPPLERVGSRVYLAGILPNTPENMTRWISDPAAIDPATAMPDQQVPERHVRDMVAYLDRLK